MARQFVTTYASDAAAAAADTKAELEFEEQIHTREVYTCAPCIATKNGCKLHEALRQIKQERGWRPSDACKAALAVGIGAADGDEHAYMDKDKDAAITPIPPPPHGAPPPRLVLTSAPPGDAVSSCPGGSGVDVQLPAKRQQCEAGGDAVSSCPPVDPADATPPPLQKYSSNKQRKKALWKVVQVRRASLAHIMEPILHIFAAKVLDMDKAVEKAKKYMEWLTMPDHMREGKGSMAE